MKTLAHKIIYILLGATIVTSLAYADTVSPLPFLSRVSSGDTNPNYLFSKLVAGTGITLTKNNPGANETITIAGSGFATGTNMWGGSLAGSIYNLNSGNVGIGTTTPAGSLHVAGTSGAIFGTATGTVGTLSLTSSAQGSPVSGRLAFGTDGTGWQFRIAQNNQGVISDLMTFVTGGNIGIGTSTPVSKLQVVGGDIALDTNRYLFAPGSGTLNIGDSSDNINIANGSIYATPNGGNVGIGTSTPATKLHVLSSGQEVARFESSDTPYISFVAPGAVTSGIIGSDYAVSGGINANTDLGFRTAGNMIFHTNGSPERMRITSAGNVGIGTTSPQAKLAVSGSDATVAIDNNGGSASFLRMFNNGTQRFVIDARSTATALSSPTSPMTFNTASTERMRIDNAGNVGIGTTTPTAKLSVTGNGTGSILMGDATISNHASISLNGTLSNPSYNFSSSVSDTNLYINRPTGSGIQFRENNGTPQMIIATGGNVGIGTTTPISLFHISGTTAATATLETTTANKTASLTFRANATGNSVDLGTMDFYNAASGINATVSQIAGFQGSSASDGALRFSTRSGSGLVEAVRINNVGNTGFGTTSPLYRIDTYNTDGSSLARFKDTDSTYAGVVISGDTNGGYVGNTDIGTGVGESIYFQNSLNAMRFYTLGTERFRISSNGNVGIGTTSPITTLDVNGTITQATVKSCSLGLTTDASGSITGCVVSDKSVKKNIKPLTKSIDTLMKLKAVTYKWKDTTKDNQVHSGFIAQEVAKVLPEAVVSAGEKLKGVDPNAVIALVVKSVQDLVIRVAGLEERLDEQQEEIDELRALLIKNNIK
jgi:hypothetical protein